MNETHRPIRMALVGCGYWGPNLARVIGQNPRSELRWLVDRDPARLAQHRATAPAANSATDLDEALRDPDLDAVAIATTVSTHFHLAQAALSAGKHVLIEKPMALRSEDCRTLISLARTHGVTLMVDHTFIYTGAVRKIAELVASGELGQVYYFDSVRVNLGLFQHDTNVIWDLAPHDLSIMDFVLPKRPVRVAAHGARSLSASHTENIAYLTLKFADETLAHFHVNWLAPAKIRRIILGGSRKMLVYDDLSPDEKIKIYDKGVRLRDTSEAASHKALAEYRIGDLFVPHVDSTEALKTEIDHFLDCIRDHATPQSDGEAGLRVVRVIEAAQESLDRDGAMVTI